MNKRMNFVLTALMVSILSLTACDKQDQSSTSATTTQESVKEQVSALPENAQTFTVGVDASYPPYDFRDENGNAIGFDVDIIKAIGEKQGFGVNVVAKDWDGLVSDFDKGVYDISLAGYYPSDERKQKYLVSRPYSFAQDILLTKKNEKLVITGLEQIKPLTLAVQGNSPYDEQVRGYGVNKVITKESSYLAFTAVARGEADAMILDRGVAQYYIQQLAGTGTKIDFELHEPTYEDFEAYELVVLAPKGKEELMEKINQGIVEIIADGTYATIYKKWFGTEPDPRYIPKV